MKNCPKCKALMKPYVQVSRNPMFLSGTLLCDQCLHREPVQMMNKNWVPERDVERLQNKEERRPYRKLREVEIA